jgi:hypothetical protein
MDIYNGMTYVLVSTPNTMRGRHHRSQQTDYEALGSAKVLLDAGKMSGRVTRNGNFSM